MMVNMKALATSTTQSVPVPAGASPQPLSCCQQMAMAPTALRLGPRAMQLERSEQAPTRAHAPSASYGATNCITLSFWRSFNVRVAAWSIFLCDYYGCCVRNVCLCSHFISIALVGALLPQLTFPALAHNPKSRLGNVDIGQAA